MKNLFAILSLLSAVSCSSSSPTEDDVKKAIEERIKTFRGQCISVSSVKIVDEYEVIEEHEMHLKKLKQLSERPDDPKLFRTKLRYGLFSTRPTEGVYFEAELLLEQDCFVNTWAGTKKENLYKNGELRDAVMYIEYAKYDDNTRYKKYNKGDLITIKGSKIFYKSKNGWDHLEIYGSRERHFSG